MGKNNISRKHHYIPQFYLKSFAIKHGKKYVINIFNKRNLAKYTHSVDNIGYIKDFHTIKINGKESDIIEKMHNEIYEKEYSKIYRKLLQKLEKVRQDMKVFNCLSNQRYIDIYLNNQLSNEEKKFISSFLAYFVLRGKEWREIGEETIKRIEEIKKDYDKAYKNNNIEETIKKQIGTIEGVKYSQLQATFDKEKIGQFAKIFYEHIWNIGLNMTDNCFYTSDNGYALTSMHKEQQTWRGVGFGTIGNKIIFPLSPWICVIMYDPKYLEDNNINIINNDYIILNDTEIKIINDEIILNSIDEVYSIDGDWKNLDECYEINNITKGHKPYGVY